MQNNAYPGSNADERDANNHSTQHKVVWTIVAGGIVGVLVILFVSLFFRNMTERTKFFTTNALSVLLLDVIIVQAYIYGRQWEMMHDDLKETRRSIKVAEDDMVYSQRAWVMPEVMSINLRDEGAQFLLMIRNHGRSPANNVRVGVVIEKSKLLPVPRDLREGKTTWVHVGTIGLGPSLNNNLTIRNRIDVTADELAAIKAKTLALYVYGLIEYDDVFTTRRYTRLCSVYIPDGSAAGNGVLSPWESGNEAT